MRGKLECKHCQLKFIIKDGIPIFGVKAEKKVKRIREWNAELRWELSVDMQSHIKWARKSSIVGERIINKIKNIDGKRLRVLDVGAGVGALHSWQFSKHGFQVVAAELCPEFLYSINYFNNENIFFERVVTDCTILPFKEDSFDVVFCKQIIHHVEDPLGLLSEVWRIARQNGLIVIEEPATSVLKDKNSALKRDIAAKIGITHHYYTLNEYFKMFCEIASNIEANFVPLGFQRLNSILPRKVKRLITNFTGGSVELIGTKRGDFKRIQRADRKVVPIFAEEVRLDPLKMEYFQKKLIPSLLEIFHRTHEKYSRNLTR